MNGQQEYRFRIDAFTPDTMPMARLAEYMADVALLLGHRESVHFVRLEDGSATLVSKIDYEVVPDVNDRLRAVQREEGPPEAMKAFVEIDRRLRSDNATGTLFAPGLAEVVEFPGKHGPKLLSFGAFSQQGTLDGIPIVVGGKADPVPVGLQDGDVIHRCHASRQMAKQISAHLFDSPIRVHGTGRWQRDEDGRWVMKEFTIAGFEELDDAPLDQVVGRLRTIPGSEWKGLEDPLAELQRLRHGPDEVQ